MLSGALRVMQGTTLATQVACGHAPRHTGKPGLGALVPCSSAARQPVPTCATSLRAGRRGAQGTATPFREVATLSPRRRVKGWGAMQFALARSLSWMALVRGRRAAAEVGVSGWVVVDCEWGRAACRSGFACIWRLLVCFRPAFSCASRSDHLPPHAAVSAVAGECHHATRACGLSFCSCCVRSRRRVI